LSLVKLVPFVLTFWNSTFHIHIRDWVFGVNHAWKGGKLVNNKEPDKWYILVCFHSHREADCLGEFTRRLASLDIAEQSTFLLCYSIRLCPVLKDAHNCMSR
jgi:hypothetical protein